jgi:DNA ligase-1
VLFADLVAASEAVAATRARSEKIAVLAEVLSRLEPDEIEPAVAMVAGEPRQGKIGVGWATVSRLTSEPAATASLTVGEVDTALTAVQRTTGAGSQASRAGLLGDLLGRATAAETDFLRRLLTGELRQGALEGVVTEAVARAAGVTAADTRRALMLSGQLAATARIALTEGGPGLAGVHLEVLRPIQPMLASTSEDVASAVEEAGPASVEWKLDGARIQVHRRGDAVAVFTRNLNDVTHRLPDVVEVARRLPAEDIVLDGEVLGFFDGEDRPSSFQDTISVFARDDGTPVRGLVPYFFDVMHLDGRDLIDVALSERSSVLADLAGPMAIPSVQTSDPDEARRFLDGALELGHEGVMVKVLASTYQAGRRGRAWRKVKPVRTLDLVVLAAEWGHGRRKGWLSNLHLGALDPDGGFVMVGKTFKGLTDALLAWQTEAFLEREVGRDGIVVHLRPELVVEIALDGVQVSPRYPGGVALRFARVRGYRPDKDPSDADTIGTVQAMLHGGRLPGGRLPEGQPPG